MKEVSEVQKPETENISKVSDEEIDFSDIPEVTDFSKFEKGPLPEYLKRRRARLAAATPAQKQA